MRIKRIGLLTGTFDPVHLGHTEMGRAAMLQCGLDEVWFLINPTSAHKTNVTSFKHREAMVHLAVEGEPRFRVGEPSARAPIRQTIAGFKELARRYSDADFIYIVGEDVLGAVLNWDQADLVAREARFAVARRAGYSSPDVARQLSLEWFAIQAFVGASSRRIRDAMARGLVVPDMDPRVVAYIRANGLYGSHE
jgi:nicotinate-nucleotide adenylyltransferase